MLENGTLSAADVAAVTGGYGNNGGFFGNDWAWIIILLLFGYGNNGFGGGFGSGANANYVLASDFATLQRQLDSATNSLERKGDYIQEQICNSDQMNSQMFANVNSNLMNGFAGVNQAIAANKYENTIATLGAQNSITAAVQDCCCKTQSGFADTSYNLATQANALGREVESGFTTTNYNMATQNCNTLQAIDKVGDRIIDYLANDKMQTLRDENQALRLAASQAMQTNSIVQQLNPTPVPAYQVANPNCCYTAGCGCGV